MRRFLVVMEKAKCNYSAYSPDLPGCVATGATREEVRRNIHEAIEMHTQGLLGDKSSLLLGAKTNSRPKHFAQDSVGQLFELNA